MKIASSVLMPKIKELLDEGKTVSIKVKGHSMWPFYKDGKTNVMLEKSTYKKYDVVLALYQNRYILHRIVKIKDNTITLRGDGAVMYEKIKDKAILGKVISHGINKPVLESSKGYRLKVFIWIHLPFRRFLLKLKKGS